MYVTETMTNCCHLSLWLKRFVKIIHLLCFRSNIFNLILDPLPMKLRALPQSFWQQPNVASNVSPGQMYTKLPPLISKENHDVDGN